MSISILMTLAFFPNKNRSKIIIGPKIISHEIYTNPLSHGNLLMSKSEKRQRGLLPDMVERFDRDNC